MKFVAISDTHCRHKNLKLPKADAIIHAGDITYHGKKSEVIDFLDWFKSLDYKHKIFIAGNHDFYFEKASKKDIDSLIPPGIIYLNDSGAEAEGLNIWGSPVTPWFFNWAFNKKRGDEIAKHWKKIPDGTDIIITHGPPLGILDTVINEKQVGCKNLLATINNIKPKAHVFGHIHESYGVLNRSGIKFINASVLNESYELTNKPVVFDV